MAGIFYPERKESLLELIDHLVPTVKEKTKAIAAIVPHGSLFTTGSVAGAVYARLPAAASALILGPNHSNIGERISLAGTPEWTTPLGKVEIDKELASAFLKAFPEMKRDSSAHEHEHGAELQLPFLQRLWKLRRFVPAAIGGIDLETARNIGQAAADALRRKGQEAFLIATGHLTRYEPREQAERMDRKLIDRILALDEQGIMEEVSRSGGSMCGAPAVAAAIAASKELGASRATLVKYEIGAAGILLY